MIWSVNWLALVISIVWSLVLGMFWYSPKVFFRIWQKAEGITDEMMASASPGKSMFVGMIANAVSIYVLGVILHMLEAESVLMGVGVSALISVGLITATQINNGSFRLTKPVVYFIDGGYRLLMLVGSGILFCLL